MAQYCVNSNARNNGDHEVHKRGFNCMAQESNRKSIGDFSTCVPAVQAAKKIYPQSSGCHYCSNAYHTG